MDENLIAYRKMIIKTTGDLLIGISIKIAYFQGRQNVKHEKQER